MSDGRGIKENRTEISGYFKIMNRNPTKKIIKTYKTPSVANKFFQPAEVFSMVQGHK